MDLPVIAWFLDKKWYKLLYFFCIKSFTDNSLNASGYTVQVFLQSEHQDRLPVFFLEQFSDRWQYVNENIDSIIAQHTSVHSTQ